MTDEVLSFRVNRWMSRGEEDCGVCRELPVVRPGKKPLPSRFLQNALPTFSSVDFSLISLDFVAFVLMHCH